MCSSDLALFGGRATEAVRARLLGLDANGATFDRQTYELGNVQVSGIKLETTPSGSLQETLSLLPRAIRWTSLNPETHVATTTGWNIATNTTN